MPLDKSTLVNAIKQAYDAESDQPGISPDEARQRTANAIANAVDAFVKSGTVNVTVAVDPTSHAGTGQGNIT